MKLPVNSAVVVVLAAIHAALLAYGAAVHSPAFDEVGHLPAGIGYWELGNTDLYRVNPPLVRMLATLPLLSVDLDLQWLYAPDNSLFRPEFDLGRQLWDRHGEQAFTYLTFARWSLIPLSLAAVALIYRWSQMLYGGRAGVLAAALWCFSPLVIANAQMITPDTGAATFGLLAAYSFWHWLKGRSIDLAVVAGLALGLALLTKFTWVILIVLWPLCWLVHSQFVARRQLRVKPGAEQDSDPGDLNGPSAIHASQGDRSSGARSFAGSSVVQFLVAALVCLLVINFVYGFDGTFEKLGDYPFVSRTLGGSHAELGNRFSGSMMGAIPMPLPRNYLLGIDRQKFDFEETSYSYLRGQWRDHGWWYYYLYGLLIKEPLGCIALVLLTLASVLRQRSLTWDELVLLLPAAALIVLVSSQTGFNRHLRYVLPAFPFVFVWTGQLWGGRRTDEVATGSESPRPYGITQWLAGAALLCAIASALSTYPHSHAHFNALVGGPTRGHEHLAGSNFDWGQDLLLLADWANKHPEVKLDGVAHPLSSLVDLKILGLPNAPPPEVSSLAENSRPGDNQASVSAGPQPGVWAVAAAALYARNSSFSYFSEFQPSVVLGYTVFIYKISEDDISAYWDTRNMHTADCVVLPETRQQYDLVVGRNANPTCGTAVQYDCTKDYRFCSDCKVRRILGLVSFATDASVFQSGCRNAARGLVKSLRSSVSIMRCGTTGTARWPSLRT